MTKSVTFIAPKIDERTVDGVTTVKHIKYTRVELVELVRAGSPGLFAVSQSHAVQVLRPQQHYQEVSEDIIEEGSKPKPSRSQEKRVRTQRAGQPDGSNDAERT